MLKEEEGQPQEAGGNPPDCIQSEGEECVLEEERGGGGDGGCEHTVSLSLAVSLGGGTKVEST